MKTICSGRPECRIPSTGFQTLSSEPLDHSFHAHPARTFYEQDIAWLKDAVEDRQQDFKMVALGQPTGTQATCECSTHDVLRVLSEDEQSIDVCFGGRSA